MLHYEIHYYCEKDNKKLNAQKKNTIRMKQPDHQINHVHLKADIKSINTLMIPYFLTQTSKVVAAHPSYRLP